MDIFKYFGPIGFGNGMKQVCSYSIMSLSLGNISLTWVWAYQLPSNHHDPSRPLGGPHGPSPFQIETPWGGMHPPQHIPFMRGVLMTLRPVMVRPLGSLGIYTYFLDILQVQCFERTPDDMDESALLYLSISLACHSRRFWLDGTTQVEMCGSRGASYDRYPECWQNGKPAPNLETFAKERDLEAEGTQGVAKTSKELGFGVKGWLKTS